MLYMSFVSFILPAEVSIEEKLNSSPLLCSTLNVVVSWVFILMLWIYMLMLWIVMQMLRIPYKNCEYVFYTHLNTGVYCIIFLYIYIYIYFAVWYDNSSDHKTVARRSDGGLTDEPYMHIEWQRLFGGGLVCLVLAFDFFYSHLGVP